MCCLLASCGLRVIVVVVVAVVFVVFVVVLVLVVDFFSSLLFFFLSFSLSSCSSFSSSSSCFIAQARMRSTHTLMRLQTSPPQYRGSPQRCTGIPRPHVYTHDAGACVD